MKWLIVSATALLLFFGCIEGIRGRNRPVVIEMAPLNNRVTASPPPSYTPAPLPTIRPWTPRPTLAPVPSKENVAVDSDGGDIVAMIRKVWSQDSGIGLRMARCESGLRPSARNGTHLGLFQISSRYHNHRIASVGRSGYSLYDPLTNILVARNLYIEQGSHPWVASRRCWGR